MGWLCEPAENLAQYRDKLIKEQYDGWDVKDLNGNVVRNTKAVKCVSKGFRGLGRVWALYEQTSPEGKIMDSFIVCLLLTSGSYQGYVECGYKDVELSMGPIDDDCPVGMVRQMLNNLFYDPYAPPLRELDRYEISWLENFASNHPTIKDTVEYCIRMNSNWANLETVSQ